MKSIKKLFLNWQTFRVFGNFGHFSSHPYPLNMRRFRRPNAIHLNQEFSINFENLISFEVAPQENKKTGPFLQSSQNKKFNLFA